MYTLFQKVVHKLEKLERKELDRNMKRILERKKKLKIVKKRSLKK